MPVKKCPKCAAVWYTDLPKCAFCGIEGEEQALPDSVGQVMDRGKTAAQSEVDKEPAPAATAVEEPPPPEPPPAPVPDVEAPPPPPPPPKEEPRPPEPQPPPAPRLPSSTVPLVFGLLGLAAAALLPAISFATWSRTAAVLLTLAASVLLPFAPGAWWTGRRYEDRCAELGFRPAAAGRLGRLLGTAVTLLLAAEGSVILFLDALRRLQ